MLPLWHSRPWHSTVGCVITLALRKYIYKRSSESRRRRAKKTSSLITRRGNAHQARIGPSRNWQIITGLSEHRQILPGRHGSVLFIVTRLATHVMSYECFLLIFRTHISDVIEAAFAKRFHTMALCHEENVRYFGFLRCPLKWGQNFKKNTNFRNFLVPVQQKRRCYSKMRRDI